MGLPGKSIFYTGKVNHERWMEMKATILKRAGEFTLMGKSVYFSQPTSWFLLGFPHSDMIHLKMKLNMKRKSMKKNGTGQLILNTTIITLCPDCSGYHVNSIHDK